MLIDEQYEKKIWEAYLKKPCDDTRNTILEYYLPLVKQIVLKILVNLPNEVEMDDLYNIGILGLVDAVEKFRPAMGTKFAAYASIRIRGAILDELRRIDWLPRNIRHKSKKLERVINILEHRLGRIPSDEEIAKEMGLKMNEYHDLLTEVGYSTVLSLNEIHTGAEDDYTLESMIEDKKAIDPISKLEKEEIGNHIKEFLDTLPEAEKLIIALYYYEELNMKEIAMALDLTESRISQIHAKIMGKMRAELSSFLQINIKGKRRKNSISSK